MRQYDPAFETAWAMHPGSTAVEIRVGSTEIGAGAVVTGACGRICHPSSRVLRRKKCMSMLRLTTIITWSLVGGSRGMLTIIPDNPRRGNRRQEGRMESAVVMMQVGKILRRNCS
jgi:hypothetical protein